MFSYVCSLEEYDFRLNAGKNFMAELDTDHLSVPWSPSFAKFKDNLDIFFRMV